MDQETRPLDLSSPPRAWIDKTLRFDQPERLGSILPTVLAGLDPPPEIITALPELSGLQDGHDAVLARRILASAAHRYFPGDNALNALTHQAWALSVLERDSEAWELILRVGPHIEQIKLPIGVLRMFLFLALRLGKSEDAAQAWGALMKWYHPDLDHTDLALHEIYLSQMEARTSPLEVSAP